MRSTSAEATEGRPASRQSFNLSRAWLIGRGGGAVVAGVRVGGSVMRVVIGSAVVVGTALGMPEPAGDVL
ncbi:hypothetical protein GCM10027039_30850 [Terrabacter koreensis]